MFRLRITRALSWVQCYAGDHKVGRYGNEYLAIRVMGVSTLLLKNVIVRFHQQRYFKRRDFSLPSGHSNSILFPVISMIREVWVAYIFSNILCAVSS